MNYQPFFGMNILVSTKFEAFIIILYLIYLFCSLFLPLVFIRLSVPLL